MKAKPKAGPPPAVRRIRETGTPAQIAAMHQRAAETKAKNKLAKEEAAREAARVAALEEELLRNELRRRLLRDATRHAHEIERGVHD